MLGRQPGQNRATRLVRALERSLQNYSAASEDTCVIAVYSQKAAAEAALEKCRSEEEKRKVPVLNSYGIESAELDPAEPPEPPS